MKKKILIVEDEVVIASDIEDTLKELGHEVVGIAISATKAIEIIENNVIDLAFLDIQIKGSKTGIELAKIIKEKYNIPFVFLSSHSDDSTLQEAMTSEPKSYVVKPFTEADLKKAINFAFVLPFGQKNIGELDHIFVREGHSYVKIMFSDILFFKQENDYVVLYCEEKKVLMRTTFKSICEKIPKNTFTKVHDLFIVNKLKIEKVTDTYLIIDTEKIPLGDNYIGNVSV